MIKGYNHTTASTFRKVLLIFVLVSAALSLSAQFAGGEGTEADPWQISRVEHLDRIREYVGPDHNNKFFIQTAHLDLGEAPWNEGEGWVPIGHGTEDSFRGKYDGNGYEIRNLSIDRQTGWNGLFGLTVSATLENITLVDAHITALANVGGLAGYTETSTIKNCSILEGSSITGATTGTHRYTAGLIGYALNTTITECYSGARVTGRERSGCLIGWLNASHITNSYATGQVNSSHVAGGLVGLLQTWGTGQGGSSIRNSYARGSVGVEGGNQIGGLVGTISGAATIENCYSTGLITGNGGGLIGQGGTATNCYWDTETSGRDTSAGGGGAMGRLTRQMVYPCDLNEAFVRWDFEEIWELDETYVHNVNPGVNDGYPYLYFQPVAPPLVLDPPVVKIEVTVIEENDVIRLIWEPVENAVTYKIYASAFPLVEDWGEPAAIVENTEFIVVITNRMFYTVVASTEEMP